MQSVSGESPESLFSSQSVYVGGDGDKIESQRGKQKLKREYEGGKETGEGGGRVCCLRAEAVFCSPGVFFSLPPVPPSPPPSPPLPR